jgi:signal transduction histidine kinase
MNPESTSHTNPIDELTALIEQLQSQDLSPEAAATVSEMADRIGEVKLEKAAFVSTVAHELRIPMTAIMGYADLLKQGMMGELNDNQLNFLGVIRENVGRMSRLIADLSDIYKVESGRLVIETLAMPLKTAVIEGVEETSSLLEDRKQSIETELPENLPMVSADPKRAAQMVHYLVENAALYSPEGSLVKLRAEHSDGLVRLEVIDSGIGIQPEDQPYIFTQFFRSEVEEVREHKGWGLSLCTVRSLAGLMGGDAGFESQHGKGSTFWVTFPVAGAGG